MLCYVSNSCKVERLTLSSTSVRVMSAFILRLAYRRKNRLHLWTRTDHGPLRLIAQPLLQGAVLLFNLIHTAVSFASFFLTTPVERRLNTLFICADSTEMMQDYPLHVLEAGLKLRRGHGAGERR
jgi:hypothetical protein